MNKKILKIALLFAIVFFIALSANSQVLEKDVKATENLETGVNFIYRGIKIPVADVTYHEFSADSVTWRKNYVSGDCYVRFNNYSDNSVTKHPANRWWGLNICTLGQQQSGGIDTLFVYYYQNDTIFSIDTIVVSDGVVDINIPAPDTITGSTINYQDTVGHTHALYINLNDLEDVNATPTNGQVLKWNSVSGKWVAANDLLGGGGGSLTVQEQDGTPTVPNVNTIKIENGHVTDEGVGVVSIDFLIEVLPEKQDFFRTGTQRVGEGDSFIDFSSPFPLNDYILTNAYALYDDGTRQNLVYDSLAVDGFRVLSILEDSATVHYLAMRALDSLGIAAENQGRVQASSGDLTLGYLDSKTDDSTITVISNKLTVLPHSITELTDVSADTLTKTGQIYQWNESNEQFEATINVDTFKLVDRFYAEMYEYENTAATTIGTQNVYHAVDNFVAGLIDGFTFVAGKEGSIASVADYSGTVAGTVLITDVAHGLLTGDVITIHETTDYNGTFVITKVTDDTFYITETYTSSQTGEWAMGSYLRCEEGSDGIYSASLSLTASAAGTNVRFKFEINKNEVVMDNVAVERVFANSDYSSLSTRGLVSLVEGDRIWVSTVNKTNSSNITIYHANITLTRL